MLCILYDVFDFIEVRQLTPAGGGAIDSGTFCQAAAMAALLHRKLRLPPPHMSPSC